MDLDKVIAIQRFLSKVIAILKLENIIIDNDITLIVCQEKED